MLPKAVISSALNFFLFVFSNQFGFFFATMLKVCSFQTGTPFSSSLSAPETPNMTVFEPGEIMMQTMIHLCFSQIWSAFQNLEDKQRQ